MPPFKFLILRYLKIGQTKALWSGGEIDKKSFTWQQNLNRSDDENNLLIIRQQGPGHSFSRHNVTWQTCGHEHKQWHTNNVTILNSLWMVNNNACINNLFKFF